MIGHNIIALRKRKGITLTELAERANISKSNLSNIERNINQNPSIKVLEKLASVLGEDLMTLLGIEADQDTDHVPEEDWVEFVMRIKKQGVTKEQLEEYNKVIEFIEWQTKHSKSAQ
ncbi:helix-turn-helix domain-containing protein [Salipaludibacillus agaradhaerens]|jgi:XRE family transcriptional regulator of biofilm formation|uniref:helix-turn-helix domain-containing protein n=1 Tax=Salipaludibacillus agaradhaerens TaxID=76935 RepID=UPI000998C685|nr:helix-turn-helix transcriptional regulator [Salipaludibacillus agaradhaerens]